MLGRYRRESGSGRSGSQEESGFGAEPIGDTVIEVCTEGLLIHEKRMKSYS